MRTTTDDIVMRYLHRALPTVGVAVLLIAGAAPAVAVPSTPPTAIVADSTTDPGDGAGAGAESMPGMDMPAQDMPAGVETSPGEPAENMPGMDMPADEMTTDGAEHAGTVSRPRGAVLGVFAGINGAVLISAAVLRRKTKNTHHPKRSTRVTTPATA
ncbi:hypothetical protein [Pengzhenrongella phosphoraccumulans]|uniref:hypothetical protein n=1 Tax=Pengzhenrongella phosphoraccumulans TaxID=3114394 RepID=UPI00388DD382